MQLTGDLKVKTAPRKSWQQGQGAQDTLSLLKHREGLSFAKPPCSYSSHCCFLSHCSCFPLFSFSLPNSPPWPCSGEEQPLLYQQAENALEGGVAEQICWQAAGSCPVQQVSKALLLQLASPAARLGTPEH